MLAFYIKIMKNKKQLEYNRIKTLFKKLPFTR